MWATWSPFLRAINAMTCGTFHAGSRLDSRDCAKLHEPAIAAPIDTASTDENTGVRTGPLSLFRVNYLTGEWNLVTTTTAFESGPFERVPPAPKVTELDSPHASLPVDRSRCSIRPLVHRYHECGQWLRRVLKLRVEHNRGAGKVRSPICTV